MLDGFALETEKVKNMLNGPLETVKPTGLPGENHLRVTKFGGP
jgi:hypothetical protein